MFLIFLLKKNEIYICSLYEDMMFAIFTYLMNGQVR